MNQLKNSWSQVVAVGHKVWSYIDEPRTHRFLWSVRYVALAVVGLMALVWPPMSIAGALPDGFVIFWGVLLLVGGLLGSVFVLRHFWLLERVSIWLTGGGTLIYLASILSLHFSQDGNRLIQAIFVALILVALIDRYTEITGDTYEPGF